MLHVAIVVSFGLFARELPRFAAENHDKSCRYSSVFYQVFCVGNYCM